MTSTYTAVRGLLQVSSLLFRLHCLGAWTLTVASWLAAFPLILSQP